MKSNLLKAIRLTLVLLIFCSGVYTFMVYGAAQLVPGKGKGVIIEDKGRQYYANIGQSFTEDKYFQGRPSATDYNAAGSGGSNKGPSNKEYLDIVQGRIDTFLVHNPDITIAQIPVELVTASGSGLDPDISPQAAMVQVKRIASVRHMPEEKIKVLVLQQVQKPLWGMLGPEKINVLRLNIALNQINK